MVCSLLARKARKTSRTFAYFYGDARFGSIWNRKESLNSKYRDLCLSMSETVTGADLQVISTEVSSAGQRVWRLAKAERQHRNTGVLAQENAQQPGLLEMPRAIGIDRLFCLRAFADQPPENVRSEE